MSDNATPLQGRRPLNDYSRLASGEAATRWLLCGPFIIRTPGAFEQEYMYEREIILDEDYLAAVGGEASVRPVEGDMVQNPGLGEKYLRWKYHEAENFGFCGLTGEALYETVQRNAVWYCAAFVKAEKDELALLECYHSGMYAWVNGRPVVRQAYGPAKGLRVAMQPAVVKLNAGENVLLFKVRPGYIADGVEFCLRHVRLTPLAVPAGCPVGATRLENTGLFGGTASEPRQLLRARIANCSAAAVANVKASLSGRSGEDVLVKELAPGAVATVRLLLPPAATGAKASAALRVEVAGKGHDLPKGEFEISKPSFTEGRVLVLTDFHFDTTYHEEQRVYAMGAIDIVKRYIDLHRQDENFKSTLSEVDYLKPFFDTHPEDRELMLRIFREGRAEPDVMYNQPNEQNCGDEGLVRNFLYGQLFHGGVLGRKCYVYNPGDVFGHPNQLSQIAAKSGCTGVAWGKSIIGFPRTFRHVSLDGTELVHQRGSGGAVEAEMHGLSVYWGGAEQTPPTEWTKSLVPPVNFAVWSEHHDAVMADMAAGRANVPITTRDMSLYHAGTALSRTELKIANRLTENALLVAERFGAIASLMGAKYPELALDKAWRQLLCGQHHDSITGTHNEISYVDLMGSYREALELASDARDRTLKAIASQVDTSGAAKCVNLVVFNPLSWKRTDVCRVVIDLTELGATGVRMQTASGEAVSCQVIAAQFNEEGNLTKAEIAFTAHDVPSMGYRAYRILPSSVEETVEMPLDAPSAAKKVAGPKSIENEFYKVEVDPARGGGITSIFDKKAGREVLDCSAGHLGNEIAVLQEVPDREETQHELYTTGLKMFSNEFPAEVDAQHGPVTSRIRVTTKLGEICGLVQEITLHRGVKRIDFKTVLEDYAREDDLFAVTFPAAVKGAEPVFDERFGVVVRHPSRNYLDFRTHQMFMFSDCGVYGANKFLDYSSSVKVEFQGEKGTAASWALGMPGIITAHDKEEREAACDLIKGLAKRGITCTPWHDKDEPRWNTMPPNINEDMLYTTFRIALGTSGSNAYIEKILSGVGPKNAAAFRQRLARDGRAHLFTMDEDVAEGWPPQPALIVVGKDADALRGAVADMVAQVADEARIVLPMESLATRKRQKVDDYGVTLANLGTMANSVEAGGVLCMLLCHTARWYGGTRNFPEGYLVPEQRDHVYHYSLYPHAGDWRKAKSYRMAHEFNFPLIAVREASHGGALPAEAAFLEIEPANAVLSALKPFGNPVAAFRRNEKPDAPAGMALRFYETEGESCDVSVKFFKPLAEAWKSNLLEEKCEAVATRDGALSVPLKPFSIDTYGIRSAGAGMALAGERLGVEAEPVQPVYVRSWEHDSESMPIGYEPVVVSISRQLRRDGNRFGLKVGIVNDYVDAVVSGTIIIDVPKGWTASAKAFDYKLDPLGHGIFDLSVEKPGKDARGMLTASIERDGQTFADVLEIGGQLNLAMSVRREGADRIIATVHNPNEQTVTGELQLVLPMETWPRELAGDHSRIAIAPRLHAVSLEAGRTREYVFSVVDAAFGADVGNASYWAVAKLMSNGRITMRRCDTPKRPHYWWAGRWWDALEKNRGW
ncbi:MAG TPA: glycoside hydrolase family 38 C-terminal domain-containing protein [Candidatus Brocadiia bacterium]|nr:glycoside hydrolase family 38 C-terminal domain-containing protein [Candidatus Brocadiia bacterium]